MGNVFSATWPQIVAQHDGPANGKNATGLGQGGSGWIENRRKKKPGERSSPLAGIRSELLHHLREPIGHADRKRVLAFDGGRAGAENALAPLVEHGHIRRIAAEFSPQGEVIPRNADGASIGLKVLRRWDSEGNTDAARSLAVRTRGKGPGDLLR